MPLYYSAFNKNVEQKTLWLEHDGYSFFPILSEDGSDMGSYHTPEMQGVCVCK